MGVKESLQDVKIVLSKAEMFAFGWCKRASFEPGKAD